MAPRPGEWTPRLELTYGLVPRVVQPSCFSLAVKLVSLVYSIVCLVYSSTQYQGLLAGQLRPSFLAQLS